MATVEDSIFLGGKTLENFFVLFFAVLTILVVITNPKGVQGFFSALAGFTSQTVNAFSGGRGFAARAI